MALITCPECGGTVSDTVSTCPHCGYALNNQIVTTNASLVNATRDAYDVVLVDSMKGNLYNTNKLVEVLDCSIVQATKILNNLPCFLYNDISYSDALYIAQELQYYGMRVALYDPNGTVTYFAPTNYTLPLPSLVNVLRTPLFRTLPKRRHEFVIRRQRMAPKPRTPRVSRPRMEMPMPNQPKPQNRPSSLLGGRKGNLNPSPNNSNMRKAEPRNNGNQRNNMSKAPQRNNAQPNSSRQQPSRGGSRQGGAQGRGRGR